MFIQNTDAVVIACSGCKDVELFKESFVSLKYTAAMNVEVPVYLVVTDSENYHAVRDHVVADSLSDFRHKSNRLDEKRVLVLPVSLFEDENMKRIRDFFENHKSDYDTVTILDPLMIREAETMQDILNERFPKFEGRKYLAMLQDPRAESDEVAFWSAFCTNMERNDIHLLTEEEMETVESVVEKFNASDLDETIAMNLVVCPDEKIQSTGIKIEEYCEQTENVLPVYQDGFAAVAAFQDLFLLEDGSQTEEIEE